MENQNKILVFKTNLESEECIQAIRPVLDYHPAILRWNVDQWDVDNVLRVETRGLSSPSIIDLIQDIGFDCAELPD